MFCKVTSCEIAMKSLNGSYYSFGRVTGLMPNSVPAIKNV